MAWKKKNGLKHCLISNISVCFSFSFIATSFARTFALFFFSICFFFDTKRWTAKPLKISWIRTKKINEKKIESKEIHAILEQQHFTLRTICVVYYKRLVKTTGTHKKKIYKLKHSTTGHVETKNIGTVCARSRHSQLQWKSVSKAADIQHEPGILANTNDPQRCLKPMEIHGCFST